MRLSHQVPELPEEFLVGCFVSGLRDAIKYDVIAKHPRTMEEVMWLARVEEEKLCNQKKGCKFTTSKGGTIPMQSGGGHGPKNTASSFHSNSPQLVKRLSPQELREKQDKGLCFYCDEKYVAGRKCKNQKILRLDIVPEEGAEETNSEDEGEVDMGPQPPIELSTHLMAGVVGVSSIRLIGKIKGKEVSFLVDSGATHNFIEPTTVKENWTTSPPHSDIPSRDR